jgi:hypothetical protein
MVQERSERSNEIDHETVWEKRIFWQREKAKIAPSPHNHPYLWIVGHFGF